MVGRYTRDMDVRHDPLELAGVVRGWCPEVIDHGARTMALAVRIARRMGVDPHLVGEIAVGALLHDAGKIGVPDSILRAARPLNEGEWRVVRRHSAIGAGLLDSPEHRGIARIIEHHHERWDGAGYPAGLCGRAIPLGARIVAVADAYDAMTSDRPYRGALNPVAAAEMLLAHAGGQFDPAVVEASLSDFAALAA